MREHLQLMEMLPVEGGVHLYESGPVLLLEPP
jgi:hypothetical protein